MTVLNMLSMILLSILMTLLLSKRDQASYSNDGKIQLVLLAWSNNFSAIDVKMNESVLEEKSSFKMLGLSFFSKLNCISRKLEP